MRSLTIGVTAIFPMSVGVAAAGVAMRRVPSLVRAAWVSPRATRAVPAILAADGSRDGPEAATENGWSMMPRQSAGGLHTVTMCEYLGRGDGMVRKQRRGAGKFAPRGLMPRECPADCGS